MMNESLIKHQNIKITNSYRTKAEYAAEQIHNFIITKDYPGGSRLLIPDICRDLNISVIPVREALRRLEANGFVEILSHRGVFVKELSYSEFENCKEVRLLLETAAIEKAAKKIEFKKIETAKSLLDQYLILLKGEMLFQAREVHRKFHFTLYKAAESDILLKTIDLAMRNFERYRYTSGKFHTKDTTLKEHQALLEACSEHNPKLAKEVLIDHIENASSRISSSLKKIGIPKKA